MTPNDGDSNAPDEQTAPYIDNLLYDYHTGKHFLFGSTRSADHGDYGLYIGFFLVTYDGSSTGALPSQNPFFCKLDPNDIKNSYVSAIHPKLSTSGNGSWARDRIHAIINYDQLHAYYILFDYEDQGTNIPMYRIKEWAYEFESFFIVSSTL